MVRDVVFTPLAFLPSLAHGFHLMVQNDCSVSIHYYYIPASEEEEKEGVPSPFKDASSKASQNSVTLYWPEFGPIPSWNSINKGEQVAWGQPAVPATLTSQISRPFYSSFSLFYIFWWKTSNIYKEKKQYSEAPSCGSHSCRLTASFLYLWCLSRKSQTSVLPSVNALVQSSRTRRAFFCEGPGGKYGSLSGYMWFLLPVGLSFVFFVV